MPFPGTLQSGGSRIDVTTLEPFNGETASGFASTGGVYAPILSITGKGLLDTAYTVSTSTTILSIRITVDGVVKVLLTTPSGGNITVGVLNNTDMYSSGSTTNVLARSPASTGTLFGAQGFKSYPTTDGTSGVIIVNNPIFFYKSLLIEISTTANTSYRYSGAYKS